MTSASTHGIKTVLHPVTDLAKAKAVYAALLGMPPQTDSQYYVGFEAEGQHIGLVPGGGPQGMVSPVAYWHVPDIEAKLADLTAACRAACFDDVVDGLPDGLQSVIGRGGVGLSLGQRQRLGLARVLGSVAPVLLFDEPTAHLDGPTEDRVLRAIAERAAGGATVIVVGHRDPILALGDAVIDMGAVGVAR